MAIFLAVPFCGKNEKRKASSGIWENNKVLINNAGSSKNFFIVVCLALQEKDLKSIKLIKWFQVSLMNYLPPLDGREIVPLDEELLPEELLLLEVFTGGV